MTDEVRREPCGPRLSATDPLTILREGYPGVTAVEDGDVEASIPDRFGAGELNGGAP